MAINIDIGKKPEPTTKVDLEVRKRLNGDIMVLDHEDIDIVIMPQKGKIMTYSKEIIEDKTYNVSNRLFKYLTKKGITDPSTIRSGNIYGSLEAKIFESEGQINSIDMALLNVGRWMEEEKPHFVYLKAKEQEFTDNLTSPGDEDHTELGEVPQKEKKGTIRPYSDIFKVRPYLAENSKREKKK